MAGIFFEPTRITSFVSDIVTNFNNLQENLKRYYDEENNQYSCNIQKYTELKIKNKKKREEIEKVIQKYTELKIENERKWEKIEKAFQSLVEEVQNENETLKNMFQRANDTFRERTSSRDNPLNNSLNKEVEAQVLSEEKDEERSGRRKKRRRNDYETVIE